MEIWYLLITEKLLFWSFREWEIRPFFWAKKLMERWYLLITEKFLFWTFWWWEIRSFFQSRSWWKDDIYWLLRSFCFKIFGGEKYGLLSAKKLMERWYLLGLFELSMIFQDLGNMVFCSVNGFTFQVVPVCMLSIHKVKELLAKMKVSVLVI